MNNQSYPDSWPQLLNSENDVDNSSKEHFHGDYDGNDYIVGSNRVNFASVGDWVSLVHFLKFKGQSSHLQEQLQTKSENMIGSTPVHIAAGNHNPSALR